MYLENALRWLLLDIDNKSTLIQVIYLCERRLLFQCIGYDYTIYVDYMDVAVREKLSNLITHSLTGSSNGLVPSGNKPLPERMSTEFYVAIWQLYIYCCEMYSTP